MLLNIVLMQHAVCCNVQNKRHMAFCANLSSKPAFYAAVNIVLLQHTVCCNVQDSQSMPFVPTLSSNSALFSAVNVQLLPKDEFCHAEERLQDTFHANAQQQPCFAVSTFLGLHKLYKVCCYCRWAAVKTTKQSICSWKVCAKLSGAI